MTAIDRLLRVARAYGEAEGIELSTVSWRAVGDSKKLSALVAGADIHTKRYELAMVWFSANWPDEAPWPEGVPRPDIAAAAPSKPEAA